MSGSEAVFNPENIYRVGIMLYASLIGVLLGIICSVFLYLYIKRGERKIELVNWVFGISFVVDFA